jgi:hypothetical protein
LALRGPGTRRTASWATGKEKANDLFRKKKYEEARRQYGTAFVHVFITKEEWEG